MSVGTMLWRFVLKGAGTIPRRRGEMYTAGVQVCAGEFEGRGLGAVPGTG
jgi:hypothetical protein